MQYRNMNMNEIVEFIKTNSSSILSFSINNQPYITPINYSIILMKDRIVLEINNKYDLKTECINHSRVCLYFENDTLFENIIVFGFGKYIIDENNRMKVSIKELVGRVYY